MFLLWAWHLFYTGKDKMTAVITLAQMNFCRKRTIEARKNAVTKVKMKNLKYKNVLSS